MKHITLKFYILIALITLVNAADFNYNQFPIQDNGRIKPLDTYARNQLLSIHGRRSLKPQAFTEELTNQSKEAVDWFFDIALNPQKVDFYNVFNISNPEVVGSLGLKWTPKHLYSRSEVLNGIQHHLEYFAQIQPVEEEDLTPYDKEMLRVYKNLVLIQELTFSLSCFLPLIPINDINIAKLVDKREGDFLSYYTIMKNSNVFEPLFKNLLKKGKDNWDKTDIELGRIITSLNEINKDNFSKILKIIPPENPDINNHWSSPWEMMDIRTIGPNQSQFLDNLSNYIINRINGKSDSTKIYLSHHYNSLETYNNLFSTNLLKLETWYNDIQLFIKSIFFYILSFLFLSISWIYKPTIIKKMAFYLLSIGCLFHFLGIVTRIVIMQRPPVTTLYESVIFVSFISIISSIFLEIKRKDGIGIFIATICGIILHLVGFGYANDGDTLGMLVAVLNSNFWLSTHVITITTGYGACLFAGLLGHVYLIQLIRNPLNKKYLKSINNNMYSASLYALFFALFGTILGGIWADQSWGRFWGWDPKENGALLIVLWLIMLLHMRVTGLVKPTGFALGLILNNIVVIMAWFGVNLLSIGLHSYGFASGIAFNITIFVILELSIGLGLYRWANLRNL